MDGEVFWYEELGRLIFFNWVWMVGKGRQIQPKKNWGPCFLCVCQVVLRVCSCIWLCCVSLLYCDNCSAN